MPDLTTQFPKLHTPKPKKRDLNVLGRMEGEHKHGLSLLNDPATPVQYTLLMFVYIFMYVYLCIYVYTFTYQCINTYIYIYTYVCKQILVLDWGGLFSITGARIHEHGKRFVSEIHALFKQSPQRQAARL